MRALKSLSATTSSNASVTALVSVILADKRAPFPVGTFNPPLIANRLVSGSVRSVFKLHSVARAGALEPVPDSSSALPYSFGPDVTFPSAWFPATPARPVKRVIVEDLGCYEAWQNATVYMEQGNYNSRGHLPGCPECGQQMDSSHGRCSAPGLMSCRSPSQGGGFNYRCVAHRTDNSQAVTYGSATPFYGVWQGYCEQMVGYSVELNEAECSSNPCKQDFMINYNGSHVNYFSGAFTPGSSCTDIQNVRQRMEISGSFPITNAWLLTAASPQSEFVTLFASHASDLFPVFGLNDANSSAILRVAHVNIEVRSASTAILAANASSGSAFQSSLPGYFQVLQLKRDLPSTIMGLKAGSYASISAQALVISANTSGELLVHGDNGIWNLLNRPSSRSTCAAPSSTASKITLKNLTQVFASVFTDTGAIVRRLVGVEPSKLFLDFAFPSLARTPTSVHVTLDESAVTCSSAVGAHIFDITLPPQYSSETQTQSPDYLDVRAFILVQDLGDVRGSAQENSDDMSGFCPNTTRIVKSVDGRVISTPAVVNRRGLTMTECSKLEFGASSCLFSRYSNNSNMQCGTTFDSPASEIFIGTSIGINNNELVNSSDSQFLSQVASFQNPQDIDLLFKFRMPQFPSFLSSGQAGDSSSGDDDSNFFFFNAASVIRGGAISELHSFPSNLTQLPAQDPLVLPRMTLSLADYALDDVLALKSASSASNFVWYDNIFMQQLLLFIFVSLSCTGPEHPKVSINCYRAFPLLHLTGPEPSKSLHPMSVVAYASKYVSRIFTVLNQSVLMF